MVSFFILSHKVQFVASHSNVSVQDVILLRENRNFHQTPGLQIRRSNRVNLGIIFNISSVKHIL